MKTPVNTLIKEANILDNLDPLKDWRREFLFPPNNNADFRGNSLGPMPGFELLRNFEHLCKTWRTHGHDGHFEQSEKNMPWWRYHEMFEKQIAMLLGVDPTTSEAVIGNTLSQNNYILLLKFLSLARKNSKYTVLTLSTFFNSDQNSIRDALDVVHGEHAKDYSIFVKPDQGDLYSMEYLEEEIRNVKNIAIVFIPGICHQTGQRFDLARLSRAAHNQGAYLGVDLAHAIGNIPLELSNWDVDFATFCSYKYLNGGPGGVGGLYVNNKHSNSFQYSPGWWGTSAETRFGDPAKFIPAVGARRFLASNDQIANMQGLLTYLQKLEKRFGENINLLFEKHERLSQYAFSLLSPNPFINIITPKNFNERGAQLSFRLPKEFSVESTLNHLKEYDCFIESRGDILRAAFVGYNTYTEVSYFAKIIHRFTGFDY